MNVFGVRSLFIGVLFAAVFTGAACAAPMSDAQLLKVSDLSAQELAYYNTLADPAARQAFLVTRSWTRLCWEVDYGMLPAIQLPDQPATFSTAYILPDEPVAINRAIADNLIAQHCRDIPATCSEKHGAPEMTEAQMITPAQMDAQELAFYNRITDPRQKDEFIKTRSYIRLCKQVLAKTLPVAQMIEKPLGFSTAYELPGDEDIANAVSKAQVALELKSCYPNCD